MWATFSVDRNAQISSEIIPIAWQTPVAFEHKLDGYRIEATQVES